MRDPPVWTAVLSTLRDANFKTELVESLDCSVREQAKEQDTRVNQARLSLRQKEQRNITVSLHPHDRVP